MSGRTVWRYLKEPADDRALDSSEAAAAERGRRPSAGAGTARLIVGDVEALCRVHEISAHGFIADVSPAPAVGRRVELEILDGVRMKGVVESCHSSSIAVAFETAQLIGPLPGRGSARAAYHARGARIRVEGFATLRAEGRLFHVCVVNISQAGAGITASDLSLSPGASVSLDLDWFGRVAGSIRWATGGAAGISFARPLSYERLAHWIWATSRAARH